MKQARLCSVQSLVLFYLTKQVKEKGVINRNTTYILRGCCGWWLTLFPLLGFNTAGCVLVRNR